MTRHHLPDVDGVISAAEVLATAATIAELQRPCGMIPWFPGGHCDPWNHAETAMALDIAGFHAEAERAYRWLADVQLPSGAWHAYYLGDGVEDPKLDTNVTAYVAAGIWHHWLITGDTDFAAALWPTVERAIDWVLDLQTPRGEIIWARHVDGKPWSYALLTGSSSIFHSLCCAVRLAELVGEDRPDWELSAVNLAAVIRNQPDAFAPKHRWAMDWYYPVLTGALTGASAVARLESRWDTFVMDGLGIRCVDNEPWVTAAETSECALAHLAVGDRVTATALLSWTRRHRHEDGSYWTGIVYPGQVRFPDGERTAYTAAAVILAADALAGASPASGLFLGEGLLHVPDDDLDALDALE